MNCTAPFKQPLSTPKQVVPKVWQQQQNTPTAIRTIAAMVNPLSFPSLLVDGGGQKRSQRAGSADATNPNAPFASILVVNPTSTGSFVREITASKLKISSVRSSPSTRSGHGEATSAQNGSVKSHRVCTSPVSTS